jgi:hypothetical protein
MAQPRVDRFRTALPVKFFGQTCLTPVCEGTIVDLSLGGAKIFSPQPFPKIDKLIMQITLAKDICLQNVKASVAHFTLNQQGCFIGVKFTSLRKDKLELILAYLKTLERK